ncbi:MAG: hypothetical protein AAB289_06640 [Chloroflexota bacterium]
MAEPELVTVVDGPKGKAEVFEVAKALESGGQQFEYDVRFGGTSQVCKSLGEAYITAGELAGVQT